MIVQIGKTLAYHIFKKPSNSNSHHLHNSTGCCFSLLFSTKSSVYPEKTTTSLLDFFIQKHQFSHKTATKAANALSHIKNPEKLDSVLAFLKENGFSKTHLEALLSNTCGPQILCSSVDRTLKPKLMIFRTFGLSGDDVVTMLSANPWLLRNSGDNRILPSILVLKDMLGSVSLVAKLLKVSVWFLKYDLEKTLLPNIEFLKSCGIGMDQVLRHIFQSPRTFLRSTEKLKKDIQKVDELKFDKNSKVYLYAVTTVSRLSNETWDKKLKFLASLGFSEDEVLQMFRRKPQFIAVSKSKIEEVVKVLFASGKYEISDIVSHPGVVMTGVENRLKPRLQVLKILEDLNLIEKWPAFSNVYRATDDLFNKKFVAPYLDALGDARFPVNKLLKRGPSGNIAAVQS